MSSVERLNRLLALVPYARRHPGITVGRMAAAFGVTPAQLRKDLQMLVMTGLPGMAGGDLVDIAWEDGFVRVTDPQVLDLPVRFTAAEATALLVGLRALAAAASPEQRREIDAVTDELAAVAGDAAQAAARVSVPDAAPPPAVDVARQALTSGRRLALRYHSATSDTVTDRDVDPLQVVRVAGHWYLEGWDRGVAGVRRFRLDRVVRADVLDAPAAPPPGVEPSSFGRSGLNEGNAARAVLRLAPAARWVVEAHPVEVLAEEPDGCTVVSMLIGDPAWLVRLALHLGPDAEVVSPAELAAQVADAARAALARYAARP